MLQAIRESEANVLSVVNKVLAVLGIHSGDDNGMQSMMSQPEAPDGDKSPKGVSLQSCARGLGQRVRVEG